MWRLLSDPVGARRAGDAVKEAEMTRKADLEAQIKVLRGELNAIMDAEASERARQLIGRCFRYRNCYSLPETDADYWWAYKLILDEDHALEFQVDKDGKVTVEEERWSPSLSGWKEITREELDTAWLAMLAHLRLVTPSAAAGARRRNMQSEHMRYLGCLGLLGECAVHVPEDLREQIEYAMADACEATPGLKYRRILNRLEIEFMPEPTR